MKRQAYKILVIDDEHAFCETMRLCLEDDKLNVLTVENGETGLSVFEKEHPDLVITDLKMPGINGFEVVSKLRSLNNNIPVIVLTAFDNVSCTIEAMQKGAYDFVSKPIKVEEFKSLVIEAISKYKGEEQPSVNVESEEQDTASQFDLIGKTAVMRDLIKQIGLISNNRANVLIEGENGTGKEVVARTIHSSGITKDHPFVGLNCTALTTSLLESELFGHEKGSYTGAFRRTKGKFELAGEGTLFLDEISEMPMEMQVKLLRVLQEKEFERVGGELSIPVKARIIASSNKNLAKLVAENKFRKDLYHRLNVIYLYVPPLKLRREDIPALSVYLLRRINKELNTNVVKIPYDAMEILKSKDWDGNVRELENTLKRAVVFAKGDTIEKIHLNTPNYYYTHDDYKINLMTLEESEKKYIEFVLNHVNWNKHKACQILDITKPTLLKKIKEYNLQPTAAN